MRRMTIPPRPDWQHRVEQLGLMFHTADGRPYWDESACYVFSRFEIDTLERATGPHLDAGQEQQCERQHPANRQPQRRRHPACSPQ